LYDSGIIPEVIALQMDMSEDKVREIIEDVKRGKRDENVEEDNKEKNKENALS